MKKLFDKIPEDALAEDAVISHMIRQDTKSTMPRKRLYLLNIRQLLETDFYKKGGALKVLPPHEEERA